MVKIAYKISGMTRTAKSPSFEYHRRPSPEYRRRPSPDDHRRRPSPDDHRRRPSPDDRRRNRSLSPKRRRYDSPDQQRIQTHSPFRGRRQESSSYHRGRRLSPSDKFSRHSPPPTHSRQGGPDSRSFVRQDRPPTERPSVHRRYSRSPPRYYESSSAPVASPRGGRREEMSGRRERSPPPFVEGRYHTPNGRRQGGVSGDSRRVRRHRPSDMALSRPVDRNSTCPFLLPIFVTVEKEAEEIHVYAWRDTCLREVINLVKDVVVKVRHPRAQVILRLRPHESRLTSRK